MLGMAANLPGVNRLETIRDDGCLCQLDNSVGEHLGMNAEVVLGVEATKNGDGDAADLELKAGPVIDEARNQFTDAGFGFGLPVAGWPACNGFVTEFALRGAPWEPFRAAARRTTLVRTAGRSDGEGLLLPSPLPPGTLT